jgi:hypothetical protein
MAEFDRSDPRSRVGGKMHAVHNMYDQIRLTSKAHPNPNYPTKWSDAQGDKMMVFVEAPEDPSTLIGPGTVVRLDGTMYTVLESNPVDNGLGLVVLRIP